jgi:hypothetical protein
VPHINYDLSKFRLFVRWPSEDVCAYCGAGSLKYGYTKGRTVAGFEKTGWDYRWDKLVFQGHMCEPCLQQNGLAETPKYSTDWTRGLFHTDPPFEVKPAGWVKYKFTLGVQRAPERETSKPAVLGAPYNLSWLTRGDTPIQRARYALNRLFGKKVHDGVEAETLRQEFEAAYRDGITEGKRLERLSQEALRRAKMALLEHELRLQSEKARAILDAQRFTLDTMLGDKK